MIRMDQGILKRTVLTVDNPYEKQNPDQIIFKRKTISVEEQFKGLKDILTDIKEIFELESQEAFGAQSDTGKEKVGLLKSISKVSDFATSLRVSLVGASRSFLYQTTTSIYHLKEDSQPVDILQDKYKSSCIAIIRENRQKYQRSFFYAAVHDIREGHDCILLLKFDGEKMQTVTKIF